MDFQDLPHLKQLASDLWKWPRPRSALMVGAGFSMNADPIPGSDSRFPTWRQLVREMFDQLNPREDGEDESRREIEFSSSNTLRLASEYEAAFGALRLRQLIRQFVPDTEYVPGALHFKLMKLPWVDVFTTNYDTLLERTRVIGRVYSRVSMASQLTTSFSPRIVKLHGCFLSDTRLIITEDDFRRYPRDFAPFINTVRQSLLENSFVLLGFSGEDPNFLAWIGWIRDELGDTHPPIYLVGPLELRNADRLLLDRRGVTPIDLAPIFNGKNPPEGLHAASIELFLDYLWAARPASPEMWPDLD